MNGVVIKPSQRVYRRQPGRAVKGVEDRSRLPVYQVISRPQSAILCNDGVWRAYNRNDARITSVAGRKVHAAHVLDHRWFYQYNLHYELSRLCEPNLSMSPYLAMKLEINNCTEEFCHAAYMGPLPKPQICDKRYRHMMDYSVDTPQKSDQDQTSIMDMDTDNIEPGASEMDPYVQELVAAMERLTLKCPSVRSQLVPTSIKTQKVSEISLNGKVRTGAKRKIRVIQLTPDKVRKMMPSCSSLHRSRQVLAGTDVSCEGHPKRPRQSSPPHTCDKSV